MGTEPCRFILRGASPLPMNLPLTNQLSGSRTADKIISFLTHPRPMPAAKLAARWPDGRLVGLEMTLTEGLGPSR